MNGDYEHALLRLLAGEGDYLTIESRTARQEIREELDSPNPNTGLYRDFAAADVRLNPDMIDEALGWIEASPFQDDAGGEDFAPQQGFGADDLRALDQPDEMDASGEGEEAEGEEEEVEGEVEGLQAEGESQVEEEEAAPEGLEAEELPLDVSHEDQVDSGEGEPAAFSENEEEGEGLVAATGDEAELEMEPCPWCRESLPRREGVNFCPFCGSNVNLVPCPACGEELEINWRFCVACGTEVAS